MNILISNDDGINAPGIVALTESVKAIASVNTVAPDRNWSGASTSLSIDKPLRVHYLSAHKISVEGTPTDCVHLAITGLLDTMPDMVLTGINLGSNLGDDVWYSGTVAAALEGRFLGLPSIAFSLSSENATKHYFDDAAKIAGQIVKFIIEEPLPKNTLLNVNIPNCPTKDIKGIQLTRLGTRHTPGKLIKQKDPHGKDLYWIGPPGDAADNSEGTDFHAISNQYVSISPLRIDISNAEAIVDLTPWANHISNKLTGKI